MDIDLERSATVGKEYPHRSHLCMVLSTPCCSKLVSRQPACSCLLILDLEAHTAFRAAMGGMERLQCCEGPLQEACSRLQKALKLP